MKNKLTLVTLLWFSLTNIVAQQTQLNSLYFYNKQGLNPAEVGYNQATELSLSYRQQWASYAGAPSTGWVMGNTSIGDNMGIGGVFIYDEVAFLKTIDAKINYSYQVNLSQDAKLAFGIGAGIINSSVSFNGILTDDYSDHILTNPSAAGTMFDAQFGALFSMNKVLNIGFSLPQMLQPRINVADAAIATTYDLQSHLNIYANYKIETDSDVSFTPMIMMRRSKASAQFDILGNFEFNDKVLLGIGIRQQGGFLINLGVKLTDKFQMVYGYEMNRNGAANSTNGTHEVMLSLKLSKIKPPKIERNDEGDSEDDGKSTKKATF
jgi:type IX secretion system PorP/SprF family membrane protein